MTYFDWAIVLRSSDFSEAARLITLFTRDHGKITARAPGSKKLTSRKGPHLELFNLVSVLLAKSRTLDILLEAQMLKNFQNLKADLGRIGAGFYLLELVDRFTYENQALPSVFRLLTENLRNLEISPRREQRSLLGRFETALLKELGFWPRQDFLQDSKSVLESVLEGRLKSERFLWQI